VLSVFVSTAIRDILSGLADLRATLGANSDRVPPEAAILGLRRASAATGQTRHWSRQELDKFSISTFRTIWRSFVLTRKMSTYFW
jgi:hypothetical protein